MCFPPYTRAHPCPCSTVDVPLQSVATAPLRPRVSYSGSSSMGMKGASPPPSSDSGRSLRATLSMPVGVENPDPPVRTRPPLSAVLFLCSCLPAFWCGCWKLEGNPAAAKDLEILWPDVSTSSADHPRQFPHGQEQEEEHRKRVADRSAPANQDFGPPHAALTRIKQRRRRPERPTRMRQWSSFSADVSLGAPPEQHRRTV